MDLCPLHFRRVYSTNALRKQASHGLVRLSRTIGHQRVHLPLPAEGWGAEGALAHTMQQSGRRREGNCIGRHLERLPMSFRLGAGWQSHLGMQHNLFARLWGGQCGVWSGNFGHRRRCTHPWHHNEQMAASTSRPPPVASQRGPPSAGLSHSTPMLKPPPAVLGTEMDWTSPLPYGASHSPTRSPILISVPAQSHGMIYARRGGGGTTFRWHSFRKPSVRTNHITIITSGI